MPGSFRIGWFLLSSAQSANSQVILASVFNSVTVGDVMNPTPTTVPANISLQQLVDAYFLPGALRYALVMQNDQLVGLITLSDIRHISREQWGQVSVSYTMIPLERLHVVSPQQTLSDVLPPYGSTMHPSVSLQWKLTGHRSCLPSAGIPNLDGYNRPPLRPSTRKVKGTQLVPLVLLLQAQDRS